MSLIVTNNKTLGKRALIFIRQADGPTTYTTEDDLTIIKDSKNHVVGVNVDNYREHFIAQEGVHSLNKEQIHWLRQLGINLPRKPWFIIGKVISREEHPKSSKLFVLKVKTDRELQIVTNSLNSLPKKHVVVANVGAILPSGVEIKESKVMGVLSQGMLCGSETLGKGKSEGVLIVNGTPGDEYFL